MHKFANFNYQITPVENIFLSAVSAAALYGRSIFTTVAVYNFKLFLWEKHWQRLTVNAERIGIGFSDLTGQAIKSALLETLEKNHVRTGRARLTFFDESPTAVWGIRANNKTSFLIQTADFRLIKDRFDLTVSPFPVNSQSSLTGIKCGNYLENVLAWEDAQVKGFEEAIRVNEKGEIVSACLANVFWKKDGEMLTPPLETGCLDGTTRAFLMENREVREAKAKVEDLFKADEIFLTSAGIGIVPAVIRR